MDFAKTINALKNNNDLCEMLVENKKSIYHLKSTDAGSYPILVMNQISDIPVITADNVETLHKITVRIHIITDDGATTKIYKKLNNIMCKIGYNRKQTTELYEDDLYIKVCDYTIVTEI